MALRQTLSLGRGVVFMNESKCKAMNNIAAVTIVIVAILGTVYLIFWCMGEEQKISDAKSKHVYGVYPGGTTLKTANNFYLEPHSKPVDPNRADGFR